MDRRKFHKLCGGLLAGAASLHARADSHAPQPKSALTFADGTAVTLESLSAGESWIFSYPYRTTPCFLVRLSESAPNQGTWPGGVDTDQSVVAFSAICSHKMSHPARPISHISYRDKPVSFIDASGNKQTKSGVISCCSERSVYDPATAGTVLSGPAPVPLAAISLATDDDGAVFATGSHGPDQYERFLNAFGFRLALEYGVTDVRARVGDKTIAIKASEFSAQQVLC